MNINNIMEEIALISILKKFFNTNWFLGLFLNFKKNIETNFILQIIQY